MLRTLIAALLAILASAAQAERRVALVIGADDYKSIRRLDNAVADAKAVGDMLETLGFEVTLETDRNLKRTRRALEDFQEDSEGADVALVYFAGHGVEIGGDNRLLPTDADASSLPALQDSSLPLEEVRDTVAGIAKVGLIILDACRNDPFGTGGGEPAAQDAAKAGGGAADDGDGNAKDGGGAAGAGRSAVAIGSDVAKEAKPGLGRVGKAEGILFAFSAAPGETASDGADGHSPFAQALIKYLGTDGLEVRSTLTLVQQEVYDLSRGRQLPYVESGLPSLFFAATTQEQLPERERLLLAMADITPDLRAEVELVAAQADMPLAPLYGALIGADIGKLTTTERNRKLAEAADAFVKVRAEMRTLASDDPEVTRLRREAEQQLSLGAFETARATLAAAADIDSSSRKTLKQNLLARTISEATTHYLAGGAARADLRYELAIDDYEKAVALYDEIENFELAGDDRDKHVLMLQLIGTMQRTLGSLPAAGDAFRRMETVIARQTGRVPDDTRWRRNLAIAKGFTADVLYDQGNLAGALDKYLESRSILNELIQKHPDDALWVSWVRDMSVNLNRTGDLRRMSGQYEAALVDYRNALGLIEILVGIDKQDAGWRFDMAISRSSIGIALRFLNDFQGALAEFDVALTIDEALAAQYPDNLEYRRHITVDLNWIGDLQRFSNKPAEAIASYERGRAITERLIAKDQQNTLYRRDLSIVLGKVGDARQMLGDLDKALDAYRSAMAITEYLSGVDPTNAEWRRDLSVGHNRVGDLLLAKGDMAAAGAEYQAGFAVAKALLDADPDNAQRILDVAYSHYSLAMAGIDRQANLIAARDALAALKAEGRLPPAFQNWPTLVDEALKASPAP